MKIIKRERVVFAKGLRRLKGKVKPVKIFGFDIETANNNRDFVCASIVGKDYEFFTRSKGELKHELATNQIFRSSFICATNLMFDFFGTFSILEAFRKFHVIERGSGVIMASTYCLYDRNDTNFYSKSQIDRMVERGSIKKDNYYKITFIDTGNHLKTSLATLGHIINIPKMEQPSFLGHEPRDEQEWRELKRYNINDSYVSAQFMEFLQREYNKLGANLKITISSTTLDLYRRQFLGKFWKQDSKENILLQYKAYYGGRTEAFRRGIFNSENYGKVKSYDVNSLYPYCLKTFRFPIVDQGYRKDRITAEDAQSFHGVGWFRMSAPSGLHIPVLPVKTDKLRFPVGTFEGYYDFNSIKLALDNGYEILKTGEGIVYENSFRPFVGMIDKLYNLRLKFKSEKNPAEIVVKLLMNSFYGKLGYKYYDKEYIGDAEAVAIASQDSDIFPTREEGLYRIRTSENNRVPSYVFPIIPLYVTSYARETMFKHFQRVGFKRVMYSDTDCIFTTRSIATSDALGDMKLENKFDEIAIIKPKFYSGITTEGKNIIKIKGVQKSVKAYEHFKSLIKSGDFTVDMTQFRKLRGALGHDDKWVNQTYRLIKTMGLDDDKRTWQNDHFTEEPQNSIARAISL